MPTAPVAFLGLVLGFAVADVTGVRPLGGIVLLGAGLWLAVAWRRRAGDAAMWGLGSLYALLFVASHALGAVLGTWPAVLTVAAVAAVASFVVADRPPRRQARFDFLG
jgi:hypothetical protein